MHPTATAAMAEDKGKVAAFGELQFVERANPSERIGRMKTKHVFVAVTSIVVVVVLVAGLIGAAYVFKSAAKDIVKFHLKANLKERDEPINEDVESDTTNDVVTYHLMTSIGEQWVLNDFSKGITTYKFSGNGNSACYVSPLNHSEADPQTVRANMKKFGESIVNSSDSVFFRITEGAIKKPAFLGETINNMCNGASIYWLRPICGENIVERHGSDDEVSSRRLKRAVEVGQCMVCGCDLFCAVVVIGVSYYSEGTLQCRMMYSGDLALYSELTPPCTRPLEAHTV
ncbi:hypothetical protein LSAT2_016890 [Lamellibrachia satsuma]|nr:hypothetical protein LSAT2_016890 [Lamellibrachia satsuma]